jgi:protein-tyrosine phosphatase
MNVYDEINIYDRIISNLFIGGAGAAKNRYGFSMIVNCTRKTDISFPTECKKCIRIDIDDLPKYHDKLFFTIEEKQVLDNIHNALQKNNKVLVHCFAGSQRSCAVVACYLIKYYKMNVEQAIQYIKNKRPIAFYGDVNFIGAIENCFSKYG